MDQGNKESRFMMYWEETKSQLAFAHALLKKKTPPKLLPAKRNIAEQEEQRYGLFLIVSESSTKDDPETCHQNFDPPWRE